MEGQNFQEGVKQAQQQHKKQEYDKFIKFTKSLEKYLNKED
jgi:hypothetical protein